MQFPGGGFGSLLVRFGSPLARLGLLFGSRWLFVWLVLVFLLLVSSFGLRWLAFGTILARLLLIWAFGPGPHH